MPRNKLIEERIELRRWQPLDRLPRWPHFHHVGWAVRKGYHSLLFPPLGIIYAVLV